MEKSKLTIMNGTDSEGSIATTRHLLSFAELEAQMVDLDTLMRNPEVRL